jgi:hypothetical protein
VAQEQEQEREEEMDSVAGGEANGHMNPQRPQPRSRALRQERAGLPQRKRAEGCFLTRAQKMRPAQSKMSKIGGKLNEKRERTPHCILAPVAVHLASGMLRLGPSRVALLLFFTKRGSKKERE